MTLTDSAYIVVAILLSGYAVTSSIISGLSLAALYPRLSAEPNKSKLMFSPVWELTNVLLLLGLGSATFFFNHAASIINHKVLGFILLALVALVVRICIVLSSHTVANHQKEVSGPTNFLLTVSSYLVPLSLSAAGVYLLTGFEFWQSAYGWALMVASVIGITVIGLGFVNRHPQLNKRHKLRQLMMALFGLWILMIGFVLPLSLRHFNVQLLGFPVFLMVLITGICLVTYIIVAANKRYNELYQYALILGFAVPLLLAWNNKPYLVQSTVTLYLAFLKKSYDTTLVIALFVSIPIMLLIGLYLAKHSKKSLKHSKQTA